jgi:hypothetical protein
MHALLQKKNQMTSLSSKINQIKKKVSRLVSFRTSTNEYNQIKSNQIKIKIKIKIKSNQIKSNQIKSNQKMSCHNHTFFFATYSKENNMQACCLQIESAVLSRLVSFRTSTNEV